MNRPAMSCSTLVFDMDGLMVDSEPLWLKVEQDFARSRGGDWPEDLARACVGTGIAHTLEAMGRAYGFEVDVSRDAAIIVDSFVARVGELALKKGCAELLEAARVRGMPCAVASSSARRLVEATLDRFAIRSLFATLVTGDCVARHKPWPDVFLEASRRLGVGPPACVVLEDSVPGVTAARAAGMRAIAVPEREPERFSGLADAVVRDLHEATTLLGLERR